MTTDTQSEHNKSVVRRYIEEVINDSSLEGNMAVVDELYVPERAAAIKQFHADHGGNTGPFPDGVEEIKDLIAEGNKVMARWIFRATHQGEFCGIPATGKQIEVTGYSTYYFENGRIAWDTMSIGWLEGIEQLGATITPPAVSPEPA